MDINIHIIIPGCPMVKKNNATTSYRIKNKRTGGYTYLDKPIHYYTEAYKDWAKGAVQTLAIYKTKHKEYDYPITDKLNMKCLFYMKDNRVVDLSALYEGIQDVLAGNEKWLKSIPPEIFQIIYDDSCRYIGSQDGSRALLDMVNPRLELTLTNYIM